VSKRTDLERPLGRLSVILDNDGELRLIFGMETAFLDASSARDLARILINLADEADDITGNGTVTELSEPETERSDTEYIADRADIWRVARGLLTGAEHEAEDIVILARFLAGDGL
jgi:hypothetical protein